ncbi:hypothetical protein CGLO_01506 [Colletotrichum gloeosporioides Cg-14]|uniref:Uncharacterized protein n=1 Tax=Colletotrichum gloeosporioides (strain Cg-14) TaxID=1237896 RepID=T0MB78_COLGC|nr:hypothetical protein CGLO_01506 [Colletotrichum gloeosporioides Cg-14]
MEDNKLESDTYIDISDH